MTMRTASTPRAHRVATMSLPVMSSPDFTPVGSSAEANASAGRSVPITVVLADDHKVVRSGLRVLLQSDGRFEVLGEAGATVVDRIRIATPIFGITAAASRIIARRKVRCIMASHGKLPAAE